VDEELIERVLVSRLDNAIKFTPPGGRITVSAQPENGAFGSKARRAVAAISTSRCRWRSERQRAKR